MKYTWLSKRLVPRGTMGQALTQLERDSQSTP